MKKKLLLSLIPILLLVVGIISYYYFVPITTLELENKEKATMGLEKDYQDQGVNLCHQNRLTKKKTCNKLTETKKESNIDNTKPGTYQVTYTYKDLKITKEVEVIDDIPPVITLKEGTESACPLSNFKEPGYTATDNYDGDITSSVKSVIEDGKVIYEVTDQAGNKTTINREFKKQDTTKPTISLVGFPTEYILVGKKYTEKGYTVKDNCDKDLKSKVKVTGSVNTNTKGTYTLTYKVTDKSGNTATATREVKVYEQGEKIPTVVPSSKTIYLTFDDGPGPYTDHLLDVLASYNVKATFFITYKPKYKNVIKRAYNEGHTIALHTASHKYSYVYKSTSNYFADLKKVSDFAQSITGEKSMLIRFPGGSSNTVSRSYKKGIMSNLAIEVTNRGYKYFDWNVSSGDTGTSDTNKIYNNVTKRLKGGKYYIVLQHDIKKPSVNAVARIIEYGKKNGYTFLPLDKTSPTAHHGINN